MSNLTVDIDRASTTVQSGTLPLRRNSRRIDASEMLLLFDSMKDGDWFEIADRKLANKLDDRIGVYRQHGMNVSSYVSVSGSTVFVKGVRYVANIPYANHKNMPTIHTGDLPPLKTKLNTCNPHLDAARDLQPGQWFVVPADKYAGFMGALSKARSRGEVIDVTTRKTQSGEFCVFRVPTSSEAPNA